MNCSWPHRSWDTGELVCPLGKYPDEDQGWAALCQKCEDDRQAYLERLWESREER